MIRHNIKIFGGKPNKIRLVFLKVTVITAPIGNLFDIGTDLAKIITFAERITVTLTVARTDGELMTGIPAHHPKVDSLTLRWRIGCPSAVETHIP